MSTTKKNSATNTDPLVILDPMRSISPLKSALSPVSSSNVLSAPALHKRRAQKRVRFAVTLEPVEEDSLPSSPEVSPSLVSKLNKRMIDSYPQGKPLYGSYIEYLRKQDALTNHEISTNRPATPLAIPEPATYTHTFVIQSKSPTIVIDSITVSTPPLHLPQIIHRNVQPTKQQSSAIDSYLKQQLSLSNRPRIRTTKKLADSTSQRHHYISIHAVPKRSASTTPSTNGLPVNNTTTQPDQSLASIAVKEHTQAKKMTEIVPKPLSSITNQINHFPDRSALSKSPKKPRISSRIRRSNDELDIYKHNFFQNYDNDHLLLPVIHSTQ